MGQYRSRILDNVERAPLQLFLALIYSASIRISITARVSVRLTPDASDEGLLIANLHCVEFITDRLFKEIFLSVEKIKKKKKKVYRKRKYRFFYLATNSPGVCDL